MATLTINTYTFTITKDDVNSYTLVAPASIAGTTSPKYTQYTVSTTGALTASTVTNLLAGNQSDTFVLTNEIQLLLFEGFHVSNKYWIVLSSYEDIQKCLLEITDNLICSNLCDNCYPNFKQDVLTVLTAQDFFVKLSYYWINPATVTTIATNLSGIPAYSVDVVLANKFFHRLGIYCDNCYEQPCNEC
jgi:hypothetical protein